MYLYELLMTKHINEYFNNDNYYINHVVDPVALHLYVPSNYFWLNFFIFGT